jgi:hypothetical protein
MIRLFITLWGGFWRLVRYVVLAGILLFMLQRSTYPAYLDWNAIALSVAEHKFDYLSWELDALWSKLTQSVWNQGGFVDEDARSDFVRDYMADLAQVQQIEAEINDRYLEDPAADLGALQTERDTLRTSLRQRQLTVENILESQVASVLVSAGFGSLGQLLPPVSMHFTQMPNLLVVSPRDSIERKVELALDALTLDDRARVERTVEDVRDVSALVVPLGGMAIFPAMIQEYSHIPYVVDVFAHEWIHHYFFFFPLGLNYFVETGGDPAALIINETVADIFGAEIAERVLARYYPEFLDSAGRWSRVQSTQQDIPAFDFGATMNTTRVTVDHLMARITHLQARNTGLHPVDDHAIIAKNEAAIDQVIRQAEYYMEHRRQIFWANGYRIRRLNQAYFAFYGGYQGGIPGIGGEDPIGPAVQDIRAASPDVHAFIITMRGITSREELLRVRDALVNQIASP